MKMRFVIALFALMALNCPAIAIAQSADVEKDFKPFLGKWEGQWEFPSGRDRTQSVKLFVYMEKGQGYVDYITGPHGNNPGREQKKLKAEVQTINDQPTLVFSSSQTSSTFHWKLKGDKLMGSPTTARVEAKGTLTKKQ